MAWVRDKQETENQTLQKLNFNMKLRIFYLEERIQKISRARAKQDAQDAKHAEIGN